ADRPGPRRRRGRRCDPRLPGRQREGEHETDAARRRGAGGIRAPVFLVPGALAALVWVGDPADGRARVAGAERQRQHRHLQWRTTTMTRSLLGFLMVLAVAMPAAGGDVEQTTTGWCSPAQNGNNNVVICNGIDPRAMARLNELLDLKDLSLKQKTAEANDWAQKYHDLNAELEDIKKQLAIKGEDATLVQAAQDLLHEGKLDEARGIFDRLIHYDEANVDRAAQDHFGRASVFALQFHLDEALPDCAQAYRYRPDDQHYASAYAQALLQEKDYPKAESVLQALLSQLRSHVKQNPAVYRPNLAGTLNSL